MKTRINVTQSKLPKRNILDNYIDIIYENKQLTNNGILVKTLENKLEEYLNVKNLIIVSNGTMALQIAFKLLELKGEVITTPFSFIATTSSLIWENIQPVFSDIDPKTLNIDPLDIETKITNKTSAILPVHVFGNPCEIEEIDKISKKYNLKLIYDASHAFGINYKNNSLLNYGDISTISFHATKLFNTIEGGALIIKDDLLANKARRMRNFGYQDSKIVDLGINAKLSEIHAAFGLSILDEISYTMNKNKKTHEYYIKNLPKEITYQKLNQYSNYNYHYFPIIIDSEEKLLKIISLLAEEDIYPRRYFHPSLNELNYYNSKEYCPNSKYISKRILCLPIYENIQTKTINKIIEIINKVLI